MELLTLFYALLAATLGIGSDARATVLPSAGQSHAVSMAAAPCVSARPAIAAAAMPNHPAVPFRLSRHAPRWTAPDVLLPAVRLMFGQRRE